MGSVADAATPNLNDVRLIGSAMMPPRWHRNPRPEPELVLADEEPGLDYEDEFGRPAKRVKTKSKRIAELEAADVPQQQSLIEIRDNELAQLREELARIRGEVYEPALDDPFVDDPDAD